MTGGEVFNVIDDNSCGGALTLASTSTKGFTISGGYIHGCIGINQQAEATGLIKVSGNSTNIVGAHTGIKMNTYQLTSDINTSTTLLIGLNSTNTVYPFIGSNGNYYAIEMVDKDCEFIMMGGRLRSYGKKNVYSGTVNATTIKKIFPQSPSLSGKAFTAVSSGTGYYDAWWH